MELLDLKIENSQKSIVQRIFEIAQDNPDDTALICKDEIVTYHELSRIIFTIAVYLKNKGIKSSDKIAIQAQHDKHCIGLYYAIHLIGGVLVPLEKNAPAMRVEEIIKDTDSVFVVSDVQTEHDDWVKYEEIRNVCVTPMDYEFDKLVFPDLDSPCEMVFTTGTTGKSKGVLIAHRNMSWYAYSVAKAIEMKKDNLFFITTPLNHAGGLRRTHLSLANGCGLVYMDGLLNIKKYFEYIEKYHVTSLYLPPVAIRLLINTSKNELSRFADQIDFVYSSSSPLPIGDCETLKQLLPKTRLYNAYEASETPGVSVYDYNDDKILKNCMGKANPGVEIAIMDEEGNITDKRNIEGQICIKSKMNMLGYYNGENLTKEVMKDGWYVSSDLGYLDNEGNIYYSGRKGDVINIGGYKISPIDVEEVALLSGSIKECICVMSYNKLDMPYLKLLVVPQDNFDSKQLISFISKRLEGYKVPKEVEIIDEVHKTFNGKIDRKYYRVK